MNKKEIYKLVILILILLLQATSIAEVGTNTRKNSILNDSQITLSIKKNYQTTKYEPTKGTYLGAYVLQDNLINNSMAKFNQLTSKKHATFFKYVGYGQPFPNKWVEEVNSLGAVPHIAFEPNGGLSKIIDDKYLRNFAKSAKESKVPIFLRYASEMNGNWTPYSGNPKLYIDKWRLVYNVMKKEAPNVIMVWTVFTVPENTMNNFYPGDKYVDWVGINIYNVMYHNNNLNNYAGYEDPLNLLNYVYNKFSYKKPIQISEFGVSHYSTTDNKFYVDFACQKINRLYKNLPLKYPRVKSIYYFDVNNLVNASAGRKINNYSITDNKKILDTYSTLIGNKNYLTEVVDNPKKSINERFTYNGKLFLQDDSTFVDLDFFRNYLGLRVKLNGNNAIITNNYKSILLPINRKKVDKGFNDLYWSVKGISLRRITDFFGYKLYYNGGNRIIYITK